MADRSKSDSTDTFVPYDEITSKTRLLESLGGLLEDNATTRIKVLEARAQLAEMTANVPVTEPSVPQPPRANWVQRLIGWLSTG